MRLMSGARAEGDAGLRARVRGPALRDRRGDPREAALVHGALGSEEVKFGSISFQKR